MSVAWYLQRLAPKCRYILVEATNNRLGGKIKTERLSGCIIERGPESVLIQKPSALTLCTELGLESRIIPMRSSTLYVLCNKQLIPLPDGLKLIVPTDKDALLTSRLFSEQGKQRMLDEEQIPPRLDDVDESLADFIRRRFGVECLERLGGPLMGGIYVADPERLSMKASFPRLLALEKQYGSLITAMRVSDRDHTVVPPTVHAHETAANGGTTLISEKPTKNIPVFFSLRDGLEEIVGALRQRLSGRILTGTRVRKIVPAGIRFHVVTDTEHIECDAMVCTVPANCAAPILTDLHPRLATELGRIRFVSSAAISLGYQKAEFEAQTDFDGVGFIISARDRRKILSCGITSHKSNYRAPKDKTLLRVFVGGDGREEILNQSDDDLVKIAQDELKDLLGIRCKPFLKRVFRWHQANPQFNVGHLDRVKTIEVLASRIPGLFLTGCSYRGVGIPDCITNAQKTVEQLREIIT